MFSRDSTIPVSSNIQGYLARTTLPRLRLAKSAPPVPSESIPSKLAIHPKQFRTLRRMYRISRKYGDQLCLDFIQKHVPSMPVQVDNLDPEEQPIIPCAGYDVAAFRVPPLLHIDALRVSWIENSVLRTVQAVLRLIPEYRDIVEHYTFIDTCTNGMYDEDQNIFQYFMWRRSANAMRYADNKSVTLILALQPPWLLPSQNLREFAAKKPKIIPTYSELQDSGAEDYSGAQKVWAKLSDVCKRNDCSSFVLTNYDQWVFGGFMGDYGRGFTMDVKEAYPPDIMKKQKLGSKEKQSLPLRPTILEFLIYWIASSMLLPDYFTLPPVPEEIDLEMAADYPPGFMTHIHSSFPMPTSDGYEPSESDWSGQSNTLANSAGVHMSLGSGSGNTLPPFLENRRASGPAFEAVAARANGSNVKSFNDPPVSSAQSVPRPPSPAQSEWSDTSYAMFDPRRSQGFFNIGTIMEDVYES